jgi:hypothetical protein
MVKLFVRAPARVRAGGAGRPASLPRSAANFQFAVSRTQKPMDINTLTSAPTLPHSGFSRFSDSSRHTPGKCKKNLVL